MKQTAVEWLYNHLFPKQLDGFSNDEWDKIDKAFEQAKAMEKEQIIDAFAVCWIANVPIGIECKLDAEQYYNETFKTKEK